jgi:hypothetical protein
MAPESHAISTAGVAIIAASPTGFYGRISESLKFANCWALRGLLALRSLRRKASI